MYDTNTAASIVAKLVVGILLCSTSTAEEMPTIVDQKIRIDGQTFSYKADTGRVAIRDTESGEPHGYMFYTAYRVASDRQRPLVFLWNGGPGANSTLLHFEAFGPKRLQEGRLIDNSETLLTVADLVFVDPIGTGFSRPAKAEYASEFYNTLGDIASVTEFVRAWLLLHDATGSPIFLIGESWGAGRAGSVGYSLETKGIPVSGLVLISGGSGIDAGVEPELRQALRTVTYAATAFYHGKIPVDADASVDNVLAVAEDWARNSYAPALARRDQMTDAERTEIAEMLARHTGLPMEKIDRQTLRVMPRQFRSELLGSEDKTLATFDMRLVEGEREPSAHILESYLRRILGYRTDLVYLGLSGGFEQGYSPSGTAPPSVNARWDYFTVPMSEEEKQAAIEEAIRTGAGPPDGGPPPPSTGEALAKNSNIKVLVASGLYDSFANCAGNREAEARLKGAIAAAVDFRCYVGDHMMYRDANARVQISNDVKTLITDSIPYQKIR